MPKKSSRKRKKNKNIEITPSQAYFSHGGVVFEIEEDAQQMFESYLAKNPEEAKAFLQKDHIPENEKKPKKSAKPLSLNIDLHGHTLKEALEHVTVFIEKSLIGGQETVHMRIITGKGRHSENNEPVLLREVYDFVVKNYSEHITAIDEPPYLVRIGGVPLKGYFDVRFR